MTQYIVHLYREMRLSYTGIDADTPDAAAAIACGKATDAADNVEDCEGENLAALVDVAGDETYSQSVTIDFEPERYRKAVPELLDALESCWQQLSLWVADLESCDLSPEDDEALAKASAVIAKTKEGDISPVTCVKRPVTIEVRGGVVQNVSNVPRGWDYEVIDHDNAEAENAGITQASAADTDHRPRFEIEHDPKENSDRVYVLVDGRFDVAIIRTDEGVIVDVYPKDGMETIATTYAFDSDVEQELSTN